MRALAVVSYAVIAAAASLRRVDYRIRLRAFYLCGYLAIATMNLVFPHSPYAEVALVTLPVLVLLLSGPRPARIATLACALILVLSPFLRTLPPVVRVLGIDTWREAATPGEILLQVSALGGFLCALMILLKTFYRFLLHSLDAQCRVTAELQQEAMERSAAQRRMREEMAERRRLECEVAAIGEAERRRLGRELHDGVCQGLTAALLCCHALERKLSRGGMLSSADLEMLSSLLAEIMDDTRKIALGLYALEPDGEALPTALQELAKRVRETAPVQCEVSADPDVRVSDPLTVQHLYRIAQEALSNAVRHAHASRIAVELRGTEDTLSLKVEDDGIGLPHEVPAGGMGLRNMAHRAQALEGELTVAPAAGGGTQITCRVPRPPSGSAAGAQSPEPRAGKRGP
ncbi:MAG: sensor histidine kinase [Bryobacteraceae bacterium]